MKRKNPGIAGVFALGKILFFILFDDLQPVYSPGLVSFKSVDSGQTHSVRPAWCILMKEQIAQQDSRNYANQIGNQANHNRIADVFDAYRTKVQRNDVKRCVG